MAMANALGYQPEDLRRLREIVPSGFEDPEDIRQVLDWYGYLAEWKIKYEIRSVRASLHSSKINCIDAAILSYGLMELLFSDVKRRLLAIHRRDSHGEECGHCVTLYWKEPDKIGAFSKSSFVGLGHRDAIYPDEFSIASSYAEAYLKMGFEPLYFGTTTLEEVASEIDWRFAIGELNALSSRIQERYEYSFLLAE